MLAYLQGVMELKLGMEGDENKRRESTGADCLWTLWGLLMFES